jgi:hypothetical protein
MVEEKKIFASTDVDFEAVQACLIFELNRALTLPTKANRIFLKNALAFVRDKLAETEPKAPWEFPRP